MSWSRQSIAEPLIDFWSELRDNIHPRDTDVFKAWSGLHSLRTEYPPPPYIGDVRRAPVFILWANGGFHPERTPNEFQDDRSVQQFRERLWNPTGWASLKFQEQPRLRGMLEGGHAVIVNAMAYRSRRISEEPKNQAMAEELPSVRKHREWLRSNLLPACGSVLVIVHRPKLWKLDREEDGGPFRVFTPNPLARYLPNEALDQAEEFLANKK
jgi:hypothetical protein